MKENWSLFLHIVNVLGYMLIVVGSLNGSSYRVIFFGITFMSFGAGYSLYRIIRFIAEQRKPNP